MSTTQMGINHRRRVVYAALRENIRDEARVMAYFQLWEREYSADAHFVVTRYTARIAQLAGFDDAQKSALLRSLYLGIARQYTQLPKYPESWLQPEPVAVVNEPVLPAGKEVSAPSSAPLRVFHTIVETLVEPVRAKMAANPKLLQKVASEIFTESVGDPNVLNALKQWAESGFRNSAMPLIQGASPLRAAVHAVYLLAADLLGPMQADRLLTLGVDRADALPEALEFSAQQLLH